MKRLNERGHEICDSRPMEIPMGFKKPESLQEQIRRMIRTEASIRAADQGMETWEEADDFDVDDDFDPTSPWEMNFDPSPVDSSILEPSGSAQTAAVPDQQVSQKAEPVGKGKAQQTKLKKSAKTPASNIPDADFTEEVPEQ